ncbi:MAG: aminotransferase class I/II-fold pyridoxal phosphate-dependent enzyme, partial [Burkholderiaceae bacterium]
MNGIERGGPDGSQAVLYDFSTNANPLGPAPAAIEALWQADRWRYPDPNYVALRKQLGAWHGVYPARVLPAAGTSEAIRRLTLAAWLNGVRTVWAPKPGYADYAFAARALGLAVHEYADTDELLGGFAAASEAAALVWICEPISPTGQSLPASCWPALRRLNESGNAVIALDRAYQPLQLRGVDAVHADLADRVWQCFSPNKALGT